MMNLRSNKNFIAWKFTALAVLLFTNQLLAAPLRVATWSLQSAANVSAQSQSNLIAGAAETLKQLNPDVILLQDVASWESCERLAKSLKPENYNVAVCSAFRDAQSGRLSNGQVAILSKSKAFLSWSESWQGSSQAPGPPGGFAFAAIRMGGKNIGFFSVQPAKGTVPQLMQQIKSVNQWTTNRLWAQMVAGEFNAGQSAMVKELELFGFTNALANETQPALATGCIFAFDGSDAAHSQIAESPLFERAAAMTEFDLNGKKLVVAKVSPALPLNTATNTIASTPSTPSTPSTAPKVGWPSSWLVAAVCLALVVGIIFTIVLKRESESRRAALLALQNTPGKILIVPASNKPPYVRIEAEGVTQLQPESQPWRIPNAERDGVMRHLTAWLKTKFVRTLVSDRAKLMETQQAAALKVLALDERLSNVEAQVRERNRSYEQRIDALLKELEAAREENRELIRAKIAALRAEMEKNAKA